MFHLKARRFPQLFCEHSAMSSETQSAEAQKRKAVFLALRFCSESTNTEEAITEEWMRGVQTQDRQPVEKPFSTHAQTDVNIPLFLQTTSCSLSSSAPAAPGPLVRGWTSLVTWKPTASKHFGGSSLHGWTIGRAREGARMYTQIAACAVQLESC